MVVNFIPPKEAISCSKNYGRFVCPRIETEFTSHCVHSSAFQDCFVSNISMYSDIHILGVFFLHIGYKQIEHFFKVRLPVDCIQSPSFGPCQPIILLFTGSISKNQSICSLKIFLSELVYIQRNLMLFDRYEARGKLVPWYVEDTVKRKK